MADDLVKIHRYDVAHPGGGFIVPAVIADAGQHAGKRFIEFFTATIRNANTRRAYARAVGDFLSWCEQHGLALPRIEPVHVAAYVELLMQAKAAPTVKLHLAAISTMLDWLTSGGVIPFNPAASVRGPKHIVKRGKTPVLTADEARQLLDGIETDTLIGLRDRALIGVMIYSFARIAAVTGMRVEDYYVEGRKAWLRLHEKGGKRHEVIAHHNAADYLDAYLTAAGIGDQKKTPLFRSIGGRTAKLTPHAIQPRNALHMVKRRALAAGIAESTCNHSFRATGITVFMENDGDIETAQRVANHASPKTTKLYDRSGDEVSQDEIERIRI